MFQFPGCPPSRYVFTAGCPAITRDELPHSEITGLSLACSSPVRFVARHVLPRHWFPEHPPYALSSLTIPPSAHGRNAGWESPYFTGTSFDAQDMNLRSYPGLLYKFLDLSASQCSDEHHDTIVFHGEMSSQPTISQTPLCNCQRTKMLRVCGCGGGARVRTEDLLRAKQALSQLSYTPRTANGTRELHPIDRLVGTPGLEPGTSALSGLRSNQLSYAPPCGRKTFTPQQCSDSFAMLNHGRDVTEALTHFRSTSKDFITSLRKDGISSVERR